MSAWLKWATIIASVSLVTACGSSQVKKDAEVGSDVPEDTRRAPMPEGPEVVDNGIRPRTESKVEAVEAGDGAVAVQRTEVNAFRRRGPAFLLTILGFEPVHEKGGFQGFKIVEASPGAQAFMTPHMQLGDVVTHVNGIRVERPDDYLQAWNTLADASVIRVDFVRGEEPMNVSWAIEE